MHDTPSQNDSPTDQTDDDTAAFGAMQARVEGTNINAQTLLATDYLNHFNEIIMTIEMIPDMPDLLEEAKEWQPKSYKQHFQDSSIADKELAIEAYDVVPARFREPFEENVGHINRLVELTIERADRAIAENDTDRLQTTIQAASRLIRRLIEHASGNIHGSERTMEQADIDALLG